MREPTEQELAEIAAPNPEPESWAGYDAALEATIVDLELNPFTDWAHSHLLYPFVLEAVTRHFGSLATEDACMLVAAKLTGGLVAAKHGLSDDEISHAWSRAEVGSVDQGREAGGPAWPPGAKQ